MIFCGQCGLQIALGTIRCPRCGTTVEETKDVEDASHANNPTIAGQSPSPVHIKIVGKNGQYYFEPPIVEASKGTTITWTNTSDTSFVITSDSKVFTASSPLAANQTFQWIPTTTGAFVYHSANSSSSIKGVIIVTS